MMIFVVMVLVLMAIMGIQAIVHKIKRHKIMKRMAKADKERNARIQAHLEKMRYVRL